MPKSSSLFILGLGNPGPKYTHTRHNVGYWVVDLLLQDYKTKFRRQIFSPYQSVRLSSSSHHLSVLRSKTFMNTTGSIIPSLARHNTVDPSQFVVVVDNMDLPPGQCRLRKGGSHAGHNGLKSLMAAFGEQDFLRLYIGVGRPERGVSVVDHVLGVPNASDTQKIQMTCRKAADALCSLAEEPFDRVAESLNRRGA